MPVANSGSNELFVVSPNAVHVHGYAPGVIQTAAVKVINTSAKVARLTLRRPQLAEMTVRFESPGGIAPGMSATIFVDFCASDPRYFYDTFTIMSEGAPLVVPIHAYPILNNFAVPRRVNFGLCTLGAPEFRKIELKSSVPLEFEYEVAVVSASPDFSIESPLAGTVQAGARASVDIKFNPSTLGTKFLELSIKTSEFRSVPWPVTVSGSAKASEVKHHALTTGFEMAKPEGGGGGGGGGGSPHRGKPSRAGASSATHKKSVPRSTFVDTVLIPPSLANVSEINFVLTQRPGQQYPQDAAQNDSDGNFGAGGRQAQKTTFLHDMEKLNREQTEREFKSSEMCLGEDLLTPTQVEYFQLQYNTLRAHEAATDRLNARGSVESASVQKCVVSSGAVTAKGEFNTYASNVWGMRKSVLRRFVQGVSRQVHRSRAGQRMTAIQSMLGEDSKKPGLKLSGLSPIAARPVSVAPSFLEDISTERMGFSTHQGLQSFYDDTRMACRRARATKQPASRCSYQHEVVAQQPLPRQQVLPPDTSVRSEAAASSWSASLATAFDVSRPFVPSNAAPAPAAVHSAAAYAQILHRSRDVGTKLEAAQKVVASEKLKFARKVGLLSLQVYATTPTIASIWQPQRSFGEADGGFPKVEAPRQLAKVLRDDALSDSESDDDGQPPALLDAVSGDAGGDPLAAAAAHADAASNWMRDLKLLELERMKRQQHVARGTALHGRLTEAQGQVADLRHQLEMPAPFVPPVAGVGVGAAVAPSASGE